MGRVSTTTAAKRLGLSRQRIDQLCKEGKLDAIRPHAKGWWQVQLPEQKKKEDQP